MKCMWQFGGISIQMQKENILLLCCKVQTKLCKVFLKQTLNYQSRCVLNQKFQKPQWLKIARKRYHFTLDAFNFNSTYSVLQVHFGSFWREIQTIKNVVFYPELECFKIVFLDPLSPQLFSNHNPKFSCSAIIDSFLFRCSVSFRLHRRPANGRFQL